MNNAVSESFPTSAVGVINVLMIWLDITDILQENMVTRLKRRSGRLSRRNPRRRSHLIQHEHQTDDLQLWSQHFPVTHGLGIYSIMYASLCNCLNNRKNFPKKFDKVKYSFSSSQDFLPESLHRRVCPLSPVQAVLILMRFKSNATGLLFSEYDYYELGWTFSCSAQFQKRCLGYKRCMGESRIAATETVRRQITRVAKYPCL